jgi:hypothetical protein
MSVDAPDVENAVLIVDCGNQSVSVSMNIEYRASPYRVGLRVRPANFHHRLPIGRHRISIPRVQSFFRRKEALAEFPNCPPADYSHLGFGRLGPH